MRIKGIELDINFAEELEEFSFEKSRIRDNKIQSCSPFRNEVKPSFAVNLENGLWVDSGAEQDHLRKGNFVSLLAYLKGETFEDIEDYLIEKYNVDYKNVKDLKLNINLVKKEIKETPTFTVEYNYSKYLGEVRSIDAAAQETFKTFETVKNNINVIALPWCDKTGKVINIKYRATNSKLFFYETDGEPIKNHLYGYDVVLRNKPQEVYIVESEIDVLTLFTKGKYAVALGRAATNDKQLNLLKKLDVETFIIATDNDAVGKVIHDVLVEELLPYYKVKSLVFPKDKKDINDLVGVVEFWHNIPLKINTINGNI